MKENNLSISGSTVQEWKTTMTGHTKLVYTQSSTLDEYERTILKGDPKNSRDLYFATGGLVSPNYHLENNKPTYSVLSS